MSKKSKLARSLGRIIYKTLNKLTGGGSSLPGKIALKISPNLLEEITSDYEVIVITGTNGKTLTTALSHSIFQEAGFTPLTNQTGSNMIQGIVTSFILDEETCDQKKLAILEVDEGSLKKVTSQVKPNLFLVTNIFEDQLDRYGSVENIKNMIQEAIDSCQDTTVIANGDLPLLYDISYKHPVYYFGSTINRFITPQNLDSLCPRCQRQLTYFTNAYANLGDYYCPNCQLTRPELTYCLDEISSMSDHNSNFSLDSHNFEIDLVGQYNIYNALASYSLARHYSIDNETIQKGFKAIETLSGRQEEFSILGKNIQLNLVKNKVGMEQVLDLMAHEKEPFSLIMVVNNLGADGEDPSWLDRVNFTPLTYLDIEKISVGGLISDQLAENLSKYNLPADNLSTQVKLEELIKNTKSDKIHIISSYTALSDLKKQLTKLSQ